MLPFGFLNINKPPGMTSHDVVAWLRRTLHLKKIGHAGTLDPLATGVLVMCLGAATRLSEYVMASTKRYQAVVQLGVVTDTYDAEGSITRTADASQVTQAAVEHALTAFIGDIQQLPPAYSAIKLGGKKLYELARAGKPVELVPRPVTIHAISVLDWQPPQITLDITCSAGTYIRSLAYDLGEALNVGAHLAGLVRTASGQFVLADAVKLTELTEHNWQQQLILAETALADWHALTLDAAQADDVLHGRALDGAQLPEGTLARAHTADGRLLALLLAQGGRWQPHKVFGSE